MVSLVKESDVDVEDIAIFEGALVGNSMADDLVDRSVKFEELWFSLIIQIRFVEKAWR